MTKNEIVKLIKKWNFFEQVHLESAKEAFKVAEIKGSPKDAEFWKRAFHRHSYAKDLLDDLLKEISK